MSAKVFVLKGMINLLFWVLTFIVLGFAAPGIVHLFAQPGAVVRSFDFASLADARLMFAQLAAVGLALALLRLLAPPVVAAPGNAAPPAAAGPQAAAMPAIPLLFAEEAFTAALNFGAICACIVLFLGDLWFLLGVAANYAIAFRIR
jgi:hypothetical protein